MAATTDSRWIELPRTQQVKLPPGFWPPLSSGAQTHVLLRADRPYEVDTVLQFREWDGGVARYTGRDFLRVVTWLTRRGQSQGLADGWVCLSLAKIDPHQEYLARRSLAGTEKLLVFRVPGGERVQRCRDCSGDIVWVDTEKGKRLPLHWPGRIIRDRASWAEAHWPFCSRKRT